MKAYAESIHQIVQVREIESKWVYAYLDCYNFDASWIPPLPLPSLYAHRAQTEETDRAITLAHLDTVDYARADLLVGVIRVYPCLPWHWEMIYLSLGARDIGYSAVGCVTGHVFSCRVVAKFDREIVEFHFSSGVVV